MSFNDQPRLKEISLIFFYQRLPFDWKNPLGYLIAIYLQFIVVSMPLRYMGCFVTLALTSFLIGMCFADDMKNDLKSIDENAKVKLPKTTIYKQLTEMINFTNTKRLVAF